MATGGYVGAPTRIKQAYTVTNMVGSIGSFESGTWNLTTAEKVYTYIATAQKKYGSNSLQMKGDTSVFERTYTLRNSGGVVKPTLDPTHKYYVRVETYQTETTGSTDIYWPIAEPSVLAGQSGPAGQWTICSAVVDRSSFSAGAYEMRLDYNNANTAGSMWFDGLMLVDLTATFGAGNEPDKTWCDANITFTTSTTTVEWWEPTYQPRARKITAAYIGIDGVARKIKRAYVGDANNRARLCYGEAPGVNYLLSRTVPVGSKTMTLGTGSIDTYTGGKFTVGSNSSTVYTGIQMYAEESGETLGYYWHVLRYIKEDSTTVDVIYEEVDSGGQMVSLTVPMAYRSLRFLSGSPPSGTLLTWLKNNGAQASSS